MLKTKPQKSIVLPPADKLGARFCQWFNHGWNYIHAKTPEPEEKIQWFTENRYPLQPRNIWDEYQDPDRIIGLRFSNKETNYCLLDIDRGSPHHPANDYKQFRAAIAALEDIGLCRPLLVRSSSSEGIHVYFFLPKAVPTFALACAVKFALEDAGFHLRSGHLEAFPNCKSYSKDKPTDYNGHRLPLQTGSYYLDDDGQPLTDDLARFLDAADVAAAHQDEAALQKAIAAAAKNRRRLVFMPGASDKAASWQRHLESRIAGGWSGRGQTNELLKDFAIYGVVWQALSKKPLVDYVVETALNAAGYRQYCGHQQDIRRRAKEWAKAAEKWYSPYCSFPKRDGHSYQETFSQPKNNIVNFENQANASSRQQAAERIQQAVIHLETAGALPHAATTRAAAIVATVRELTGKGMSFATLHRPYHLSLWHPTRKTLEPAQGAVLQPVLDVLEKPALAKTLEPAQGAVLQPVLDVLEKPALAKTLEPAQGAVLQPTLLYEGGGADERLPQPPQGEGRQPLIPLPENNSSPSDPQRLDAAAEGSKFLETLSMSLDPSEVAKTASADPEPPSGRDVEKNKRLTITRLLAIRQAKKLVQERCILENLRIDPAERQRQETTVMMQLLWNSGEPEWQEECKFWLVADPSRKLDLS